ncbi:tryptophan-rich antigen [Plasmodium gonderi]|uniref:Tryptophan-rich antigen n=1 Tax=Plasmodium gonderi TaxID=77519 RepID=A0A1Y1JL89_PLAGO|nr:tryptophan-rich antigen [Plasmodium gonderi]GAW80804.1 tryptophan-rich antigen [Plasmodium gonderi]
MNAKILSPLFFIVLIEVSLNQRCSGNPKWMKKFKYEDNYWNPHGIGKNNAQSHLRCYFDEINKKNKEKKKKWKVWFDKHKIKIQKELNNVEVKFIKNVEIGWDNFMRETENKWLHYNDDMNKEYKCTLYPEALKWGVIRWIAWFKETGLVCLKQDFHKFMTKYGKEHQTEVKKVLQKWHNVYLNKWCNQPWKLEENYHCKKWENFGSMIDPYYNVKAYQWKCWMERTKLEHKEWVDNLRHAETNFPIWKGWKKRKYDMYKLWLKEYSKQWIANEQWKTWTEERKKHILSKSEQKKPAQKKTVQKKK